MKLTRILPKVLAKEWQRYDLAHTDSDLEYHKMMANYLQQRSEEGHAELDYLNGGKENEM